MINLCGTNQPEESFFGETYARFLFYFSKLPVYSALSISIIAPDLQTSRQ